MLSRHLDAIKSFLQGLDRPVCRHLQPGIDKAALRKSVPARFKVPSELRELYSWHNGTHVEQGALLDDLHFLPGFYFLSAQDAFITYRAIADDPRWNQSWYPLFANGGGDFYAIDLAVSDHCSGPMIGFMLNEAEQEIEYESISAFAASIADAIQLGIIYNSEAGYLEMNDEAFAAVAHKRNPTVKLWRTH